MSLFETLVALLAVAVLLLQITRRLHLPYPGVLAAAGVAVAMLPGAPAIPIEPHTALALFIAPVLIDSAYDFPLVAVKRMLIPIFVYAVLAVFVTTGVVVMISDLTVGLPLAVAITLGAIVAPPDAAAATAVLSNLPVDRRVDTLLKGESLFNDATALLLFTAALTIQESGEIGASTVLQITLAAPGGVLFGIAVGYFYSRISPIAENTISATLMQFVYAFATWQIAEKLHLSAVLATVSSAMTLAAIATVHQTPRMRVHSFAVWTTVVFVLNVVAFLLMGLQARFIIGAMSPNELIRATKFASTVIVSVIIARIAIAFLFHWIVVFRHRRGRTLAPFQPAETMLVGWAGMRGLVTLATAFALPSDFPERDLLVLTAFGVVFATLVLQGATLAPMIRMFDLGREGQFHRETDAARSALAEAALIRLADEPDREADDLKYVFMQGQDAAGNSSVNRRRELTLSATAAQRKCLQELRDADLIGSDQYLELQEALDWQQLAAESDKDHHIEEG